MIIPKDRKNIYFDIHAFIDVYTYSHGAERER